jgi:hypothetical protein
MPWPSSFVAKPKPSCGRATVLSVAAERLFVIIRAGASLDCASPEFRKAGHEQCVPPLIQDLFSVRYSEVLDQYPVAQMVAADLAGLDPDSLVLEEHIRSRYRDSTHQLDQIKFLSLPPYLQDLMHRVSHRYARAPDNHDRLIDALLRLPDVVFVSLNYDTLLDDRLALTSALETMDDYVAERQPSWALIKLHGSVNWGRGVVSTGFSMHRPSVGLELEDTIQMRHGNLRFIREDSTIRSDQPWQFYPVLSVPVGQADEIACPQAHIDALKEKLGTSYDGVDLLVVGYSANDREVLTLLRENGRPIRSLWVVNRDARSADEVASKLRTELQGLGVNNVNVFGGSYAGFARPAVLSSYLEWLNSLPSLRVM